MLQDIRFAARLMVKDRRFTLVSLLVLGLGIGINNMLFTILNAHTIRGLPIAEADRVLYLSTIDDQHRPGGVSLPELEDLRAGAESFSGIAAFVNTQVTVGDEGRAPERVAGAYITANVFDVIRTGPIAGRSLLPEDDRPGASPVVLLGNSLWRARYAGDPAIIGHSIRINGMPRQPWSGSFPIAPASPARPRHGSHSSRCPISPPNAVICEGSKRSAACETLWHLVVPGSKSRISSIGSSSIIPRRRRRSAAASCR